MYRAKSRYQTPNNEQHLSAVAETPNTTYPPMDGPEFYQKIEQGIYKNIPGIDEAFEKPENPDFLLSNDTDENIGKHS